MGREDTGYLVAKKLWCDGELQLQSIRRLVDLV